MVEKWPRTRTTRDPNKVLEGIKHGRGGYQKGCGCSVCTTAEREYQQSRKAKGFQPRNGQSFRSTVDTEERQRVPLHIVSDDEDGDEDDEEPLPERTVEPKGRKPKPTTTTPRVGPVERSVVEECSGLSIAVERPGSVEMARCLARILDDKKSIGLWPTTSRQLQSMLNDLRGNSKRKTKGRLAKVQNLTRQAQ